LCCPSDYDVRYQKYVIGSDGGLEESQVGEVDSWSALRAKRVGLEMIGLDWNAFPREALC